MQKCLGCGSPSLGEYCPRCLREQRPDLTGVIRKGGASPSTVARQADAPKEPRRAAPIGFTAEPAKPSGLPRKKAKVDRKQSAQSGETPKPSGLPGRNPEVDQTSTDAGETLSRPLTVKVTPSTIERLESLARLRSTPIPDLLREAIGDFLEANDA